MRGAISRCKESMWLSRLQIPRYLRIYEDGNQEARLGASPRIGSRQRPRKRCSAWLEARAIQQTKPQCDRDDSLRSYQKAYPHTSAQVPPLWAQLQILTAEIEYSTEAMWIWEKWHLLFSQSSEYRKITEDPEWGTACQLVCSCLAPPPRDFLEDVCLLLYSSTYRDAKHIYLQH